MEHNSPQARIATAKYLIGLAMDEVRSIASEEPRLSKIGAEITQVAEYLSAALDRFLISVEILYGMRNPLDVLNPNPPTLAEQQIERMGKMRQTYLSNFGTELELPQQPEPEFVHPDPEADSRSMQLRSAREEMFREFKPYDIVGVTGTNGRTGWIETFNATLPRVLVRYFDADETIDCPFQDVQKIDLGIRIEPFLIEYRSPDGTHRVYARRHVGGDWKLITDSVDYPYPSVILGNSMNAAIERVYDERTKYLNRITPK